MQDFNLIADWLFKVVTCAIAFSVAFVLGVVYGVPSVEVAVVSKPVPAVVSKPAPAAVVAEEFPNLNMRLRYPRNYSSFEEGFSPEFREAFHAKCGKFPSKGTVGEACHVGFDVMVNHHFGSFSKEKLNEVMKDDTHEEWVGFAQVSPGLQSKLERALAPVMMRRMANKTLYE